MADIKVYSTPTCPYCKRAKAYLTELGEPFQDLDVSNDEGAAADMVRLSGQMGVPVIVVDGKVIVGFDRQKIDEALGRV